MALRSGHGTRGTGRGWKVRGGDGFPLESRKEKVKSQRSKKQKAVKGIISALIISSFTGETTIDATRVS